MPARSFLPATCAVSRRGATFLKLEWASPTCTHPERPLQHEEEFVLVLDGAPNGVVNRELVVPVDAGIKAMLAAIS